MKWPGDAPCSFNDLNIQCDAAVVMEMRRGDVVVFKFCRAHGDSLIADLARNGFAVTDERGGKS